MEDETVRHHLLSLQQKGDNQEIDDDSNEMRAGGRSVYTDADPIGEIRTMVQPAGNFRTLEDGGLQC